MTKDEQETCPTCGNVDPNDEHLQVSETESVRCPDPWHMGKQETEG